MRHAERLGTRVVVRRDDAVTQRLEGAELVAGEKASTQGRVGALPARDRQGQEGDDGAARFEELPSRDGGQGQNWGRGRWGRHARKTEANHDRTHMWARLRMRQGS